MNTLKTPSLPRMVLVADTAEELMTPNPISIHATAALPEALELLTERGFSAAPVIDEAGRPLGVLSRTDLLVHKREQSKRTQLDDQTDWDVPPRGPRAEHPGDTTVVRDLMTPVIFTVTPETTTRRVVEQMLSLRVHHLFVVDKDGILVGVIGALDLLRHLHVG
jgi:CBS domain-containing protein